MTAELKIAIENLYSTFAIYPLHSTMEGCPCCVSDSDKEKMHSKELRELDGDDLSRYAFKAMTTWGDTEDFKHYLPRIFELVATTDFIVDTSVVLGKLDYGKWQNWSEEEKNALVQFLFAWWTNSIKHKSHFDVDVFTGIISLTGDLEQVLSRWPISLHDNSFLIFVDFVYNYYNDLAGTRKYFGEIDEASIEKILQWIKKNSEHLEKGFFLYADRDSELAEKISAAQYICERT